MSVSFWIISIPESFCSILNFFLLPHVKSFCVLLSVYFVRWTMLCAERYVEFLRPVWWRGVQHSSDTSYSLYIIKPAAKRFVFRQRLNYIRQVLQAVRIAVLLCCKNCNTGKRFALEELK